MPGFSFCICGGEPKNAEQWEKGDVEDAAALMKPAGEDVLQMRPVSQRVNSSRADKDDATLIDADRHSGL
jgi:putative SOS response-associated peptidase YedK